MTNVVEFFERVYGIKSDEESEYGFVIVKNQNRKEMIYDSSFEELVQDAFNKMGIKTNADKLLRNIDERKPFLPMPNIGENVTIEIISTPKIVESRFNEDGMITARCKLHGCGDSEYDLILTNTIYKGIIQVLRDSRIPIDDELKCTVGHIFTIIAHGWYSAPKHFWKNNPPRPPKIYSVILRRLDITDIPEGW